MTTEKMREEFIDWLADVHDLESEWQEERNCFKDFPAHLAFQAWQASRAELVIELPNFKPKVVRGLGGGKVQFGVTAQGALNECVCVLEMAGLTVRVAPREDRIFIRTPLMLEWATACMKDMQILWRSGYPSVVTSINGGYCDLTEVVYAKQSKVTP
jgi:hypothetical protein